MAEMRVAICTSLFAGIKSPLLADYMRLGLALGRKKNWKFLPYQIPHLRSAVCLNSAVHMTRTDKTLNESGEKFDRLLWLDYNCMISADDAIRLIEAVDDWHPAVFAFSHDPDTEKVDVWEWTGLKPFGRLKEWPEDELVRVSSAGTSAAAFDADVFDVLRTPYFELADGKFLWPDTGPDAFVCRNFHRQGIPVYAHSGIWAKRIGKAQVKA